MSKQRNCSFSTFIKLYYIAKSAMRPRAKPPNNRKYFHTKRKMDKKDIAVLKKKIDNAHQKKALVALEVKKQTRLWGK